MTTTTGTTATEIDIEWAAFVAEATARGDANRIPTAKRDALALIRQGYSGWTVAHMVL